MYLCFYWLTAAFIFPELIYFNKWTASLQSEQYFLLKYNFVAFFFVEILKKTFVAFSASIPIEII